MNGQDTYILVRGNEMVAAYDVSILIKNRQGGFSFMTDMKFVESNPAIELPIEARVRVERNTLQRLADDLYALGIRPTFAEDTRPALEAKNQHIEDLRKIVFHLLGEPK